ncbi:MAG: TIGR02186 family protein [Geminicoccaceae bacterium]
MVAAIGFLKVALILVLFLAGADRGARAQTVTADLSNHLIAIDTGFSGSEVLLFGTVDEAEDVVVVVRGPPRIETVRRKARILGIWINSDEAQFARVPGFYAVAANGPLTEVANDPVRARLQIGLDKLVIRPLGAMERQESLDFRNGLVRDRQRRGLYQAEPGTVRFIGQNLFRTTLDFPANVPPGIYQVEVFGLRNGEVVGAQSSALVVNKIGLEAALFDFAHDNAHLYGVAAILLSLLSGWTAAAVFRRG